MLTIQCCLWLQNNIKWYRRGFITLYWPYKTHLKNSFKYKITKNSAELASNVWDKKKDKREISFKCYIIIFFKGKSNMFWVKGITDLFHFRPILLQSSNPQSPRKNKKNLEKALESLKQIHWILCDKWLKSLNLLNHTLAMKVSNLVNQVLLGCPFTQHWHHQSFHDWRI